MRTTQQFTIPNISVFKKQLLYWAQQFQEVVWLDSNTYQQQYSSYDAILAVDAFTTIKTDDYGAFETLKTYQKQTRDWIFGYLSYDLKNDVEQLSSKNSDELKFPELFFFQPKKLFLIQGNRVEVLYLNLVSDELLEDYNAILETSIATHTTTGCDKVKISVRMTKSVYVEKVKQILAHIRRGDIYEANLCQEFFAANSCIDPIATFHNLNTISTPPFASFLKLDHWYGLCASPERYLRKEGQKIISQPIKGTAKRSPEPNVDAALKKTLAEDPKERSENIMIVDLVRNDLSKTAEKGSVIVEELCKVYSFEQVHQMISTVVSTVNEETSPIKVLQTTFPMGSMTGAPKVSAMQIIEAIEMTKRGLYSGAIGYITSSGDFDFNVVIRSILYNEDREYVSYTVGGAITAQSIPEKEYEECLLKAKAMREVLEGV